MSIIKKIIPSKEEIILNHSTLLVITHEEETIKIGKI